MTLPASVERDMVAKARALDERPTRLARPVWSSDLAGWTVGSTATHVIDILPMIVNHRVVLTDKREFADGNRFACYEAGWCYESMEQALAAVKVWPFETHPDSEPPGYVKRAI